MGLTTGALLVTVLCAPAAWLAAAVWASSESRVSLAEPRGSIWNGSAQLVLRGGTGSQDAMALPGRIRWEIRPQGLGLDLKLNADCCTPQALLVTVKLDGIHQAAVMLKDGQSRWPASVLSGLGTPWNTVRPQGDLFVQSRGLAGSWASGRVQMEGQLQIDAREVSSRLSTLQPVGSFSLALTGGKAPTLDVSTLEGSLQLSGHGEWTGGRLRFLGEASASPERQDALANLLNILGRRDGARSIIKLG